MNSQLTMPWVVASAWLVFLGVAGAMIRRAGLRLRIERRMFTATDPPAAAAREPGESSAGLRRWLHLAGYRDASAASSFILVEIAALLIGFGAAIIIWSRGTIATLVQTVNLLPGGVGDILLPLVYTFPWLLAAVLASLPWLYVRHQRRRRVEQIEQDFPLTLELLATLSESGLGFDAALDRVLNSQRSERPLVRELRAFQLDTLAGRPRVECFRRLARRMEVSALNVFISALVQAEQVGASVAAVLRRQADDCRDRRREDALALAMAMPVKRLFPLMICFLPGIFVATMGPVFYQFFQYVDTVVQVVDFGAGPNP